MSNASIYDRSGTNTVGIAEPPGDPRMALTLKDMVLSPPQTASATRIVTEALVAQLKRFEGFSVKAYGDYKQYSIGYGTKARSRDEVIDRAEADRRLREELTQAAQSVQSFAPNAPLGWKQALTDLTYNAGPIWEGKGLGQHIAAGQYKTAEEYFLLYDHAGGVENDDLKRRRETALTWIDHPLLDGAAAPPQPMPGGKMTDATAPASSGLQHAAETGSEVIATIQRVEPWIATVLPIIVPQSAPVVKIIEAFSPVILAAAARALSDIAQSKNGDLLPTLVELLQHLTPGQPNSPALSGVGPASERPQGA